MPFSTVGKPCKYPADQAVCKESKVGVYVDAIGDGLDLPPFCVFDNVTIGAEVQYWNQHGEAISNDPNVRQVCSDKEYQGEFFIY